MQPARSSFLIGSRSSLPAWSTEASSVPTAATFAHVRLLLLFSFRPLARRDSRFRSFRPSVRSSSAACATEENPRHLRPHRLLAPLRRAHLEDARRAARSSACRSRGRASCSPSPSPRCGSRAPPPWSKSASRCTIAARPGAAPTSESRPLRPAFAVCSSSSAFTFAVSSAISSPTNCASSTKSPSWSPWMYSRARLPRASTRRAARSSRTLARGGRGWTLPTRRTTTRAAARPAPSSSPSPSPPSPSPPPPLPKRGARAVPAVSRARAEWLPPRRRGVAAAVFSCARSVSDPPAVRRRTRSTISSFHRGVSSNSRRGCSTPARYAREMFDADDAASPMRRDAAFPLLRGGRHRAGVDFGQCDGVAAVDRLQQQPHVLALVADLDGRRRDVLLEFCGERCLSRLLARAQQPEAEQPRRRQPRGGGFASSSDAGGSRTPCDVAARGESSVEGAACSAVCGRSTRISTTTRATTTTPEFLPCAKFLDSLHGSSSVDRLALLVYRRQ